VNAFGKMIVLAVGVIGTTIILTMKVICGLDYLNIKKIDFQEVIRLAAQAKSEGWAGDWDKRIEKAKKKVEKPAS
jgi:hypothetical protein